MTRPPARQSGSEGKISYYALVAPLRYGYDFFSSLGLFLCSFFVSSSLSISFLFFVVLVVMRQTLSTNNLRGTIERDHRRGQEIYYVGSTRFFTSCWFCYLISGVLLIVMF